MEKNEPVEVIIRLKGDNYPLWGTISGSDFDKFITATDPDEKICLTRRTKKGEVSAHYLRLGAIDVLEVRAQ